MQGNRGVIQEMKILRSARVHLHFLRPFSDQAPKCKIYCVLLFVIYHEIDWFFPCSWLNYLSNSRLTISCCFYSLFFSNCWHAPCSFDYMLSGSWRSVPCPFQSIFTMVFDLGVFCSPSFCRVRIPSLICLIIYGRHSYKRIKKLWCCVGGGNKVIWLYQLSWKCKLATVTSYKADVSSGSPSSERMTKG